jgi:phosphoribosylformylglycinamidine cyclo-ligase
MKRVDVVDNARIHAGDVIVGLSSFGKASYEDAYNGGMGSNGLTSARHDVFHHQLSERYPESYDHAIPSHLVYSGKYGLLDESGIEGVSMGNWFYRRPALMLPLSKKSSKPIVST